MKLSVEDRLARLEREVRGVRAVMLLLLVSSAGVLLAVVLPPGRADAVEVVSAIALLLAAAGSAVYLVGNHGVADIARAKEYEGGDEPGHRHVELDEPTDGARAIVSHNGGGNGGLTSPPAAEPDGSNAPLATSLGHVRAPRRVADDGHGPPLNVHVELSYLGRGMYEAKVTENGRRAEQRWLKATG